MTILVWATKQGERGRLYNNCYWTFVIVQSIGFLSAFAYVYSALRPWPSELHIEAIQAKPIAALLLCLVGPLHFLAIGLTFTIHWLTSFRRNIPEVSRFWNRQLTSFNYSSPSPISAWARPKTMEINRAMVIYHFRRCINFVLLHSISVDCSVKLCGKFEILPRSSRFGFGDIVAGNLHLVHNRFVIWTFYNKIEKCQVHANSHFFFLQRSSFPSKNARLSSPLLPFFCWWNCRTLKWSLSIAPILRWFWFVPWPLVGIVEMIWKYFTFVMT